MAGDIGEDWFGDVLLYVISCLYFAGAADFADHDDAVDVGVVLEQLQAVDKAGTGDAVTANANDVLLAQAGAGQAVHGFVGEGAAAADNANAAGQGKRRRNDA